jgi:hypothetical protein
MESFNQNVIKHKTGLLNLAAELRNISKACKMMGFSRDTFYRYQTERDAGGVEALFEVSRRKPNLKNRVEESTELAVTAFAIDFPAYGQVRASNELCKQGVFVSPSGVHSIWLRHNLASMKQRLAALEKKSAEEGIVLTEARCKPWNAKSRMMKLAAKSKLTILGISAARTPFTSALSRAWAAFTSKLLWTHIPSGQQPSSIQPKRPSPALICSMIACLRSFPHRKWVLSAS